MVLLSTKAGLRACEIAGLTWDMILDPSGRVGRSLYLEDRVSKYGSGRTIPLHPELRSALTKLKRLSKGEGAVIRSARGGHMRANSLVNWFGVLYRQHGLKGCSSHSGRRTFITEAARALARSGGSLRDIQLLAGHRSIETTQRYIEGDQRAQHRLVASL